MRQINHNLSYLLLAICLLIPVRLSAGTVNYQYDSLHRLTMVAYEEGITIQYTV